MPRAVIGYHAPCPDGTTAALAAVLALTREAGTSGPLAADVAAATAAGSLLLIPLPIYEPLAARTARVTALLQPTDELYLVDFSGGKSFIEACCAGASRVVMLDHHKTALEDMEELKAAGLPANLELHIDMERSGAGLARDFFLAPLDGAWATRFGDRAAGLVAHVNRLVDVIQDGDLWRHALPETKGFYAGMMQAANLEMDGGKNTGIFDTLLNINIEETVTAGVAAQAAIDALIAGEVARAYVVEIPLAAVGDAASSGAAAAPAAPVPTVRCLAVFTTHPEHRSELGNQLAARSAAAGLADCAVVAYKEAAMGDAAGTHTKASIRGLKETDVSAICKVFGGGGHKLASSCIVPDAVFASWRAVAAATGDGAATA